MLVILAVLGMVALSAWHGLDVHDDDAVHAVSIRHVHDGAAAADPDGAIHVAAHTAGQGLAVPSAAMPIIRIALHAAAWPARLSPALYGLDPGAILRPPRP